VHDLAGALLIIGAVVLLLGLFDLIPASAELRDAQRASFRRPQQDDRTPGYIRYARQRGRVLHVIGRPCRWIGGAALVIGLLVLLS
jgi:hypothetical protein